jgi:hypothetical protein
MSSRKNPPSVPMLSFDQAHRNRNLSRPTENALLQSQRCFRLCRKRSRLRRGYGGQAGMAARSVSRNPNGPGSAPVPGAAPGVPPRAVRMAQARRPGRHARRVRSPGTHFLRLPRVHPSHPDEAGARLIYDVEDHEMCVGPAPFRQAQGPERVEGLAARPQLIGETARRSSSAKATEDRQSSGPTFSCMIPAIQRVTSSCASQAPGGRGSRRAET